MAKNTVKVNRSSVTGEFVSDKYAKTHPRTTETERRPEKKGQPWEEVIDKPSPLQESPPLPCNISKNPQPSRSSSGRTAHESKMFVARHEIVRPPRSDSRILLSVGWAVMKMDLGQFRCEKPECDSWLSLNPRNDPVDLRCACGALRLNLKEKVNATPKVALTFVPGSSDVRLA